MGKELVALEREQYFPPPDGPYEFPEPAFPRIPRRSRGDTISSGNFHDLCITDCDFGSDREFADYEEKLACLLQRGIGLWDNLHSCERSGSLDSDIKNAEPNDFEALCIRYPALKRFLFNGQQSYKFFKRYY